MTIGAFLIMLAVVLLLIWIVWRWMPEPGKTIALWFLFIVLIAAVINLLFPGLFSKSIR